MWAKWPAIVILGLLAVAGTFYVNRQRRLYIDAKVRDEYRAAGVDSTHRGPHPEDRGARRPRLWTVVLAVLIVLAVLAGAIGLIVVSVQ